MSLSIEGEGGFHTTVTLCGKKVVLEQLIGGDADPVETGADMMTTILDISWTF